jgi:type II secretory pathway component PulC
MSPARRFEDLFSRWAVLAPLLSLLALALLARAFLGLPSPGRAPAGVGATSAPVAAPPAGALDWTVFHNPGGTPPAARGVLAGRFRLAGTFLSYGSGTPDSRKAVLDDLKQGGQRIVSESETIDDVVVARVFSDHVLLRAGTEETELWLGFARDRAPGQGAAGAGAGATAAAGADWLGGRRVGENRWIFSRAKLTDYYNELKDQPERMLKVFDSLKPLYDEQHLITGYHLGVEGEEGFFDAVGMKEGDVVRAVNSMKMTNRRRAEFFIKEFVEDRANVFVLDIERDGKPQQLVYEVR